MQMQTKQNDESTLIRVHRLILTRRTSRTVLVLCYLCPLQLGDDCCCSSSSSAFIAVFCSALKGQMVFKQIKQIANYSCYLSLIIGSFFILSLHISLLRRLCTSLFCNWLISCLVIACALCFFVHYVSHRTLLAIYFKSTAITAPFSATFFILFVFFSCYYYCKVMCKRVS